VTGAPNPSNGDRAASVRLAVRGVAPGTCTLRVAAAHRGACSAPLTVVAEETIVGAGGLVLRGLPETCGGSVVLRAPKGCVWRTLDGRTPSGDGVKAFFGTGSAVLSIQLERRNAAEGDVTVPVRCDGDASGGVRVEDGVRSPRRAPYRVVPR
jgi:hypothetical protein